MENNREDLFEIFTIINSHSDSSGKLKTAMGRMGVAMGDMQISNFQIEIIKEVLQAYEEKLVELGLENKKLKEYKKNARISARNYQKAYQDLERRLLKLMVKE